MPVGEAADEYEAQRLSQEHNPNVLLDLNMLDPSAFETVVYLREHCSQVKVVMLTAYGDDNYVRGVAGNIEGYVLKDEAPETVVQAIRTVMQGGAWFSKPIVEKLARLAGGEAPPIEKPVLTKRELEVLRLVALGLTDNEIAQELNITHSTVRFHLRQISEKLGLRGKGKLAAWALEHGLLTPRGPVDTT